jgi:hypothetical protein
MAKADSMKLNPLYGRRLHAVPAFRSASLSDVNAIRNHTAALRRAMAPHVASILVYQTVRVSLYRPDQHAYRPTDHIFVH